MGLLSDELPEIQSISFMQWQALFLQSEFGEIVRKDLNRMLMDKLYPLPFVIVDNMKDDAEVENDDG